MKFALVGPTHPHRGGIAQYNTSLFRALAAQNEVRLISFSRQYPGMFFPGQTQRDESCSPFRVPAEPLIDSLSPPSWKLAGARIAAEHPIAVVFQWWQPFFGPIYSSIIKSLKKGSPRSAVIFLCHNVLSHDERFFPGRRSSEAFIVRRTFREVDGFLVHSEGLVAQVEKYGGSSCIRKIFHPIYDFYSKWDLGTQERGHGSPPCLLFFGKIRPYKGFRTFLEALGLLKNRIDFRAIVAGEFYVNPAPYRRLVEQLGISERIIWKDHYIPNEEVPSIFRQSDVVVLPYVEATQSGVVPVAYQFGVPVIATRVGGLSEVVLEGETGYLVPPGNAAALADRIFDYFERDKQDLFRKNIADFRQKLTWQQVVDNLFALLAELRRV